MTSQGSFRARVARWITGVRDKAQGLPRGVRSLLGVLLMIGGVFGALPILGFWMIPLGAALVWMDLAAFRKKRRKT